MAKPNQKESQFPLTPPIGYPVVWFERGQRANGAKAAVVTDIERPGTVKITTFGPNMEPRYYKGVRHISVCEADPHDAQAVRCGGWDWVEGLVFRDAERLGREDAERKELARMQEEEDKARRARERAEAEAKEEPANA